MKQAFLSGAMLMLLSIASNAQETVGAPYNPDSNADSLISVPDILSIIPLFGQEFLPSEDDLDSTNEIQSLYISNDTLYLIPNGGFILLGDIAPQINLDSLVSSLSVDSTFLANVGGIGSGGCDFNFPEKESSNLVHHSFNDSGDYTVPLGKHLYVLGDGAWNGNLSGITGAFTPAAGKPAIFYGGQILQDSDGNGSFHGYLVEASNDISPVHHSFNDSGDYTVPLGKHLYVLGEGAWNGNLSGITGAFTPAAGKPAIFYGGQILQDSDGNGSFHGYLVNESYFDGCGGVGEPVTNNSNGGGGTEDILFPDGTIGDGVTTEILSGIDYSVPEGKRLYLMGWVGGDPILNGNELPLNSGGGRPYMLNEGEFLGTSNLDGSLFNGLLVDLNPEISAITINVTDSYTVPDGKVFYLMGWKGGDPILDGFTTALPINSGGSRPYIFNAGQTIGTTAAESVMHGYLRDI